jgi:AcrR family transcriptional regulator
MAQVKTARMAGEDRRRQLIQVAVDLFARQGFEGTTTKQIAESAGVNEAIIFRHFATKVDLYTAILDYKFHESGAEEWLNELRAHAAKRDDEAFVRLLISKILESYRRDPQFQRLMLYACLEGHELSRISNERTGLPIFAFLRDYVVERQREGAFAKGDAGLIVLALVGAPCYYSIVTQLFRHKSLRMSRKTLAATFTRLILGGILVPGATQ